MPLTRADISGNTVPKLKTVADIGNTKLTREDRQVLARIDGQVNFDGLVKKTGLSPDKVKGILLFLAERRLIELPGDASTTGPRPAMSDKTPGPRATVADKTPGPRPAAGSLRERMMQPLPKGDELFPLVEELFLNLETLSYYDLLGISRSADPAAVKKAYLLRTKTFHPDRFYRRASREFKDKLQEIFKQINKGYRVLSDAEQRTTYDNSLAQEDTTAGPEVNVVTATRARAVKGETQTDRPFDKGGRKVPVKIAAEAAEEEIEAGAKTPSMGKPQQPKLKLSLRPGEKQIPAYMEKIIKEKAKGQQATVSQAERFFQGAMIERDRGNYAAAAVNLKLAMQYAPYEQKYKKAMEDLGKDEESKRAELEFKSGLEAHSERDLHTAASHYRKALQLGYENAKLYHKFAEVVIELEGNFEKARSLCLKAIELQPGVADFHFTLARAYKGLGQKGAAILQMEKVISLDPKNKFAAKELKALKRS